MEKLTDRNTFRVRKTTVSFIFLIIDKVLSSAKDPFNFEANPDPGSALEKNGPGSRLFP